MNSAVAERSQGSVSCLILLEKVRQRVGLVFLCTLMHCMKGPKIKSIYKGHRPLSFAMTDADYMAGQSRTDVRRMHLIQYVCFLMY